MSVRGDSRVVDKINNTREIERQEREIIQYILSRLLRTPNNLVLGTDQGRGKKTRAVIHRVNTGKYSIKTPVAGVIA